MSVADAFSFVDHRQQQHTSPLSRFQLHMVASPTSISSSSSSAATKPAATNQYPNRKLTDPWYSIRIQKDMEYSTRVKSLYIRHVLVERKETAQLALDWYMQLSSGETVTTIGNKNNNEKEEEEDDIVVLTTSRDPFGDVAKQLSACSMTREEGGKIGWVDIPSSSNDRDSESSSGTEELSFATLIPKDVLEKLVELQPKAGDVHIVGPSSSTNQVHVIRVEELYVPNILPKMIDRVYDKKKNKDDVKLGAFNGVNALIPRNKLKGHGVMPRVPKFERRTGPKEKEQQQQQLQRTYAIQTNGCQMNVADSERLEGILQDELGLMPISDSSNKEEINNADVVIFNTCSIRDHAEQKLYDALGPFRARKRQKIKAGEKNKNKFKSDFALIVTGCVAQQEGKALLRKIPEIDVVLGPQYVPYLGSVLEQIEWGHQLVVTAPTIIADNYKVAGSSSTTTTASVEAEQISAEISTADNNSSRRKSETYPSQLAQKPTSSSSSLSSPLIELPENDDFSAKPIRGHSVRAWVNVIYGCNEHCTYCVVPSTRGMEQSRSMETILQECVDLVENRGYKEITLLGQNIDAYGRDMVPKRTFGDLLHFLDANLPPTRLRYVTSHPRYFSDRVIDAVASLDKICECFHMPFQAGDNDVLRRMRRGYTFESYMRIINKIRAASPDAAITADVIVGFPGETEAAFQRTLDLMEAVKFDNLNSFAYSPRPNTEAATWTDESDEDKERLVVPEEVKKERLARVQELAVRHGAERSQRYLGRTVEVLVEDKNPRIPGQVMGRTRQGRQVFFDGIFDELKGELVYVEITEARTWSLMGKPI
eukprot:CAMPEP_0168219822 /NCGR_PEP_ID=MMETSP0140_2-20121125/8833_1 /TAXON_ID=44445 /ORGANISM="Pseudo-nitzschia australis, Strain 10249 10 AB" /LENGTH=822 /DNA_ID=CAMNT_0008148365 /DNA_START=213 /DNA_END=2681 /DNA_ORIENTATION=+